MSARWTESEGGGAPDRLSASTAAVAPHTIRSVWDDPERAAAYAERFALGTAQVIPSMMASLRARFRPGARLIDLACGPGRLAAAAAAEGWRVDAVDRSPAMAAIAATQAPEASVSVAPAEQLPFEAARADAAAIAFGIASFDEPERALREVARVLRPDGLLAVADWADAREDRSAFLFQQAFARHGDDAEHAAQRGSGPDFLTQFHTPDADPGLLRALWLEQPTYRTAGVIWDLAAPEELFDLYAIGNLRIARRLSAQSPTAHARIRDAVTDVVARRCQVPTKPGEPERWRVQAAARITTAHRSPHGLRAV